jgi:hypothetical protein
MADVEIVKYAPELKADWDAFVQKSKNGTFQNERNYMEYHGDRFQDCSLIANVHGAPVALLPVHHNGRTASSHMGLTFGGLITSSRVSMRVMRQIFVAVVTSLQNSGFTTLIYKTVPHIYHRQPAEEDRDLLFRYGATLIRRNMFSVIEMRDRAPIQQRRLRSVKTARRSSVVVGKSDSWSEFWDMLKERLAASYQTSPVHSLSEITRLHGLFPNNISLFTACEGSAIVAGVAVYETDLNVRLQYIASSDRGRDVGALDLLLLHLLDDVYPQKRFMDLGSSNDTGDKDINFGVMEFKEGFGARAIAHDWYEIDLSKARDFTCSVA